MNDEQTKLWNGPGARGWIEVQTALDAMYQPFEDLLLDAVAASPAERVLDIGCGTGTTTIAIARSRHCTGIDVSEPMIAVARTRGSTATFIAADAQTYPFERASFDLLVSRFGVMFFDDPVAAFTNLRRAASDGAELRCIAWRSAAENPFMTTAERAAAPLLPNVPPRRPDAPGQFAFADRDRVQHILETSGWSAIDVRPIDVPCAFPADELPRYLTWMGPVGRILQEADEPTRTGVVETLRGAFAPYVEGAEVRFVAACWVISARG